MDSNLFAVSIFPSMIASANNVVVKPKTPIRTISPAHNINGIDKDNPNRTRVPVPATGTVSLRGGAGSNTVTFTGQTGFIYSHQGGKRKIFGNPKKKQDSMEKCLELLGLDPDTDWEFKIDQYQNFIEFQDQPRPKHNRGSKRSVKITKTDSSAWETSVLTRIMNPTQDWMMAVDYVWHDGRVAPPFLSPAVNEGLGNPIPADHQVSFHFLSLYSSESPLLSSSETRLVYHFEGLIVFILASNLHLRG
jgi:hypothetical protein